MNNFTNVFSIVPLFDGIVKNDLNAMLKCLGSTIYSYIKDDIILMSGDSIEAVGIILSGDIVVTKEDYSGNRSIITNLVTGELFGEVFACAGIHKSPVTVIATTNCEVMFIVFKKIVTSCSSSCAFHTKLIENMMKIMADKNIMLNNMIEYLCKRTIRDKLSAYLLSQFNMTGNNKFNIKFNRNELADFLCVDRSALSRELSKMRDDGLINFNKSNFEILDIKSLIN